MSTVQPDIQLEKMNLLAYVVSVVVLLLVGLMRRGLIWPGHWFSFLPPLHASLNALTAVILLVALWSIKNKTDRKPPQSHLCRDGLFRPVPGIVCIVPFYYAGNQIRWRRRYQNRVFHFTDYACGAGCGHSAFYPVDLQSERTTPNLKGIKTCPLGIPALAVCGDYRPGLLPDVEAVLLILHDSRDFEGFTTTHHSQLTITWHVKYWNT